MLLDLLLPETDGAVLVQAVSAVFVYSAAAWFLRRHRDLVVFVAGLATFTAGLMGLRTLH